MTIQRGAVYGVDLSGSKMVTDQDLAHLLVFPAQQAQDTSITDMSLDKSGQMLTLRQLHFVDPNH